MRGLWEQIQQDTSPQWRQRTREEAQAFFWTTVEEARLVRTRSVNPLDKGRELRFLTTACRPAFTLTEYAYGIQLPQEIIRHPLVHQARKASTAAVAYANDILGLKADLLRGIRDNLVLSLQEEYGGDLQDNAERAADMFHAAAGELINLREQFHSGEGPGNQAIAGNPDVEVYLQILDDWVHEGIKWQLRDTNRYSTTVRLTQQENPNPLVGLVPAPSGC